MAALAELSPLQLVAEFDNDGASHADMPAVFGQRHLRKFREHHRRGGNSNFWGGFIDLSSLNRCDLDLLYAIEALPEPFDWEGMDIEAMPAIWHNCVAQTAGFIWPLQHQIQYLAKLSASAKERSH